MSDALMREDLWVRENYLGEQVDLAPEFRTLD